MIACFTACLLISSVASSLPHNHCSSNSECDIQGVACPQNEVSYCETRVNNCLCKPAQPPALSQDRSLCFNDLDCEDHQCPSHQVAFCEKIKLECQCKTDTQDAVFQSKVCPPEKRGKLVLDPTDRSCESFISCSDVVGFLHMGKCPKSLIFNEEQEVCDWKDVIKCPFDSPLEDDETFSQTDEISCTTNDHCSTKNCPKDEVAICESDNCICVSDGSCSTDNNCDKDKCTKHEIAVCKDDKMCHCIPDPMYKELNKGSGKYERCDTTADCDTQRDCKVKGQVAYCGADNECHCRALSHPGSCSTDDNCDKGKCTKHEIAVCQDDKMCHCIPDPMYKELNKGSGKYERCDTTADCDTQRDCKVKGQVAYCGADNECHCRALSHHGSCTTDIDCDTLCTKNAEAKCQDDGMCKCIPVPLKEKKDEASDKFNGCDKTADCDTFGACKVIGQVPFCGADNQCHCRAPLNAPVNDQDDASDSTAISRTVGSSCRDNQECAGICSHPLEGRCRIPEFICACQDIGDMGCSSHSDCHNKCQSKVGVCGADGRCDCERDLFQMIFGWEKAQNARIRHLEMEWGDNHDHAPKPPVPECKYAHDCLETCGDNAVAAVCLDKGVCLCN